MGTNGAALTYAAVADLQGQVADVNAETGSIAFLANTKVRRAAAKIVDCQAAPSAFRPFSRNRPYLVHQPCALDADQGHVHSACAPRLFTATGMICLSACGRNLTCWLTPSKFDGLQQGQRPGQGNDDVRYRRPASGQLCGDPRHPGVAASDGVSAPSSPGDIPMNAKFPDGTETRATPCEFRVASSGRRLEGYAAVFASPAHIGGFTESVRAGAFAASLASGRDVLALQDHDPAKLLGRTRSGTLKLAEDTRGLHFDLALPDTAIGRDILALAERSDLGGMSFGFRTRRPGRRLPGTPRAIKGNCGRSTLHEISVVCAWPAYGQTTVSARARPDRPRPCRRANPRPVAGVALMANLLDSPVSHRSPRNARSIRRLPGGLSRLVAHASTRLRPRTCPPSRPACRRYRRPSLPYRPVLSVGRWWRRPCRSAQPSCRPPDPHSEFDLRPGQTSPNGSSRSALCTATESWPRSTTTACRAADQPYAGSHGGMCSPRSCTSGRLVFDVVACRPPLGGVGVPRRLFADECLFIRDRSDDGWLGRSRISRGAAVLPNAAGLAEYAGSVWSNAATPSGVLELPANSEARGH